MRLGLVTQIPTADFSKLNFFNAVFPAYDKLHRALFFGDKVPHTANPKKIAKRLTLGGDGIGGETDYSLQVYTYSYANTELALPQGSYTMCMVLSLSDIDPTVVENKYFRILGADSGRLDLDTGKEILFLDLLKLVRSDGSPDRYTFRAGMVDVTASSNLSSENTSLSFFIALSLDNDTLQQAQYIKSPTADNSDKKAMLKARPETNEIVTIGNKSYNKGIDFHSLCVFDSVLTDQEVEEVYQYYKNIYSSVGVEI